MEEANKQSLTLWIGIGISLLCLVAIFLFINPAEIWQALKEADIRFIFLGVLGFFFFLIFRAIRWRLLLGNVPSYWPIFHLQNIGYMLNYILPARLGDVSRAILVANLPSIKMAQGISTMVVERVLDLLFMATLLPLTLVSMPAISSQVRIIARNAGILGLIALLILIIAANQPTLAQKSASAILDKIPFLNKDKWLTWLDDLLNGLKAFTRLKDGLWLLFLSIILWLPILAAYYWFIHSVGIEASWPMSAFVMTAAAFTIAAPSSPGQVGVFHAGVTYALNTVLGFDINSAVAFAIIYHAFNLIFHVLIGLVGVQASQNTFSQIIGTARQFKKKRV